jgi:heptosyltransferase-2
MTAIDRGGVKRILVITLSNIGDIILTTPVIRTLAKEFPDARIDVMSGPSGRQVFEKDPRIFKFIVYDKYATLSQKRRLQLKLKKLRYNMVVDLKNTAFPLLLMARYRTSPLQRLPAYIVHKKQRHLYRLKVFGFDNIDEPSYVYIPPEDGRYVDGLLESGGVTSPIVVLAPGARSHLKRWPARDFGRLAERLAKETGANIVFTGSADDAAIVNEATGGINCRYCDLTGKTNLRQLAALLKRADLVITNDSAPLHMACAVDAKVLALFGPTDPKKYGPTGEFDVVVQKKLFCAPCESAVCGYGNECMKLITVDEVYDNAKLMLEGYDAPEEKAPAHDKDEARPDFKRIMIARTDKIGDLVLSTPVLKAVRQAYPKSYIAAVVRPYAADVIKDNPYIDELIPYDKEGESVLWDLKFVMKLRSKKFDVAILLHPKNRTHIIAFLAGIPHRVGYNKKLGILLTKKIPHLKQYGLKHEIDYTLDILKYIGINPKDKSLYVAKDIIAEHKIDGIFKYSGITPKDTVIVLHPGASCPSKRWSTARFAEIADKLADKFLAKIVIIAGPHDKGYGDQVAAAMRAGNLNLSGKTVVSEIVSVLRRSKLFISNDSGPVHIACAVGTPTISIFGRSDRGLSPERWKPVGPKDVYLHKDVGCRTCLSHNCKKGFACIQAVTADDVYSAANKILS